MKQAGRCAFVFMASVFLLGAGTVDAGTGRLSLRRVAPVRVKLGDEARVWLRASGGTTHVRFTVSPLPLPKGAQLDGATGVFTFSPDAADVGRHTLTFTATDGTTTSSRKATVTVKGPAAKGVTALTGRLLDSNVIVKAGKEVPIVGATVSLLGTPFSATTNKKGRFRLSGIPAGPQVFDIDASTARPAKDGATYAGFRESIVVIDKVTNVKRRPFYLPRIAPGSLTTIDPNATTVVANADLGVSFSVAPHTAKNADGTDFTGQMSVSEVLDAVAPVAKPRGLHPALLVTIQPIGVTFSTPAPITFPNREGFPPGSETDLWSLDAASGRFSVVGRGVVSVDGASITMTSGGVRAADWHCSCSPPPPPPPPPNVNDDDDDAPGGSVVRLSTGSLSTSFELPPAEASSRLSALAFVWHSEAAAPFPIVQSQSAVDVRSAVPPRVSYTLTVGGQVMGSPTFIDTSAFDEDRTTPYVIAAALDATTFATGSYAAELLVTNDFPLSRASSVVKRHVDVVNAKDSPFGHGWGLAGLERIVRTADGGALVVDGAGGSHLFQPGAGARRDLLLADIPNDRLLRFNGDTGELVGTFVESGAGGLDVPHDPTFGPDGNVYVVSSSGSLQNAILRFDGRTGAFIDVFVPSGSNGLGSAAEIAFGPDGNLYASDARHGAGAKVRRYSGLDGSPLGIAAEGHGMQRACGIAFGPRDGLLYVMDNDPFIFTNYDRVLRFDGATGAFVDVFVQPGNLDDTCQLDFGPDGDLYIPDARFRDVRRFSGADGHFVGVFASGGPLAAKTPYAVRPGPEGVLYVSNDNTVRYDLATGQGTMFIDGYGGFPAVFPAAPVGATGTFESAAGDFSRLDLQQDGTFTRTFPDGRVVRFDAGGLETSDTDRNGVARTFTYDAAGRLTRVADGGGPATDFAYADGLVTSATDAAGRVTTFEHDAARHLVRSVLPGGIERRFGYDARHLMTSETDPDGHVTTREYDAFARWKRSTLPGGVVRSGTHSLEVGLVDSASGLGTFTNPAPARAPADLVSTFTDGAGGVRTNSQGAGPGSLVVTDPVGLARVTDADANGNAVRVALPSGDVLRRTWDTAGNLLAEADDLVGGTRSFTYAPGTDRLATATDPFGGKTLFEYDAAGNRTRITSPAGLVASAVYDTRGLVTSLTDRLGTVTTSAYDAQGNLTQRSAGTPPAARTTSYSRTPEGYVGSTTDAEGRQTAFAYDEFGRVTQATLPGSRVVAMAYDASGRLVSVTPPEGAAHALARTPFGQISRHTAPAVGSDARDTNFDYDPAQRLVKVRRADGRTVDIARDAAGRVTSVTTSRGQTTYQYDASGRLVSATTPENLTAAFGHTGSLVTAETWSGAVAGSVSTAFDKSRRRTSTTVNGTTPQAYLYDAESRLTQSGALTLTYSALTGLPSGSVVGGLTETLTFDAFGGLASDVLSFGPAALYSVQDTRDRLGRVVTRTEQIGGSTTTRTYAYDAAGRLSGVTTGSTQTAGYTYDANGNRLFRTGQSTENATYDARDRVVSYGATAYVHSASGERTSQTVAGQTTSFTCDELGNLTRVDLAGGSRIDYLVDALQRRVVRRVDGAADRSFLWDGGRIAAELDAAGNRRSVFLYGSRPNVPDVMLRGGVTYRIVCDPAGSPRLVVDTATGATAQRLDYDEFGRVLLDTNPGFQPFGFAGGLFDFQTGLVRFGARDYDPGTGRFLAPDPLLFAGGDTNLYAYAGSDPVNPADVSGAGEDGSAVAGDPTGQRRPGVALVLTSDGIVLSPRLRAAPASRVHSAAPWSNSSPDATKSSTSSGPASSARW